MYINQFLIISHDVGLESSQHVGGASDSSSTGKRCHSFPRVTYTLTLAMEGSWKQII
jgi:hypothetical protein